MPKYLYAALIFFALCIAQKSLGQSLNIIPYPQSIKTGEGGFIIHSTTKIIYDHANPELAVAIDPLISKLKKAAGLSLQSTGKPPRRNYISVQISNRVLQPEGYHLTINKKSIQVEAATPAGAFYAVQTLLQLLPAEIESDKLVSNITWKAPAVEIEDGPRFGYRGLMLDVARHFMPYSFLEKMIDLMAMQKMNTFHLHLTDSQGWRFESKKYPKLNQIAAYRKGTPLNTTYDYASRPTDTLYGGYYTQEQLKKLVAYAKSKFITIVPEIEMPAHSRAALAAYPELACLDSAGKAFPYPTQIQDEYCTKDSTFTFLTDILTEVMDVFPSKYIHIAGDEATKVNWRKCPICQKRMKDENLTSVEELQSYFIKRIGKFVNDKGREIIGWDEIIEGGLAPTAAVMSWRGEQGGITAARLGHKVVMTPEGYCYLDHYQSADPNEPPAFGGLTTLSTVYNYNPIPAGLNTEEAKLITGTQGNLWTEYISTSKQAEYMYFPRSTALAEVAWTGSANKQPYDQFLQRLQVYFNRLNFHQVNYAKHLFDIKINTAVDTVNRQLKASVSGVPAGYNVYYTTDGSAPATNSARYTEAVSISGSAELNVGVINNGLLVDDAHQLFTFNKATGRPSTLATPPNRYYNKGGSHAWNNGVLGNDTRYNDGEWLAWNGRDFEGTVDLGTPQDLHSVAIRLFNKPSSWIYLPQWVSVSTSDNGIDFTEVARKTDISADKEGLQVIKIDLNAAKTRYVKITAKCFGLIPKGSLGEGTPAWLFVDEVKID